MNIKHLVPKNKIVYNNKECIVIKFYEKENLCLIAIPVEIGYDYLKVDIELLSKKIVFKENQNTIKIGKNKVCRSDYEKYNRIDLHIVMPPSIESGYDVKYVEVYTIDNVYLLDEFKKLEFKVRSDFYELDIINIDLNLDLDIKYMWTGSYTYDKKTF